MKKQKILSLLLVFSLIIGFVPVDFVEAAAGDQKVLFDMQTVDLSPLETGGSTASIPFLRKNSGTFKFNSSPKTVEVTGRTGTSQGLQVVLTDINVYDHHEYKIDYSGIFPNNPTEVARIRYETGSASLGTKAAVDGVFSMSVTRTSAQIKADATGSTPRYSLGNNSTATADLTYTGIVITQICLSGCDGTCKTPIDIPSGTFTHINLNPGKDSSQMGVSWFTPKGYTPKAAYIQLAKVSELVIGKHMPVNPTQFTGTNATGTSLHDSNKGMITGLAKNTEYAYRVGDGTNWSDIYKFKTQDVDAYSIMVVADPQLNTSSARVNEWKAAMKEATSKNPNLAFV
ncbi:MAG: fibronectin type III domain-containing protein, partial [Oscillospiraceae bacterium]|nr:fibronectin type III domain-containing protein [Oscillospiraceae bacterium]